MQLFKFVKKQLENLGLHGSHLIDGSPYTKYRFHITMFAVLTILAGIPVFKLKSVAEFATGIFGFLIVLGMFYISTVLMSQAPNIHKLNDFFEEIIQKRGFRISIL